MAKQIDFSQGSVYKNIVNMAIPITAAQLVHLTYNIVDRIFIGRIEGAGGNSLTGVGLCMPIIAAIIAFAMLIGHGGGPLFGIERGKKNDTEAALIMGNSFIMLVSISIIITALGNVFCTKLLYLFGASSQTIIYAEPYIRIYLLGTVFAMISLGMNPFINGQGFAKVGMLTVWIGAVLNIILDPILIFGLNLGVSGAAIATVVSQFASAVWVLIFLTGDKALVKLTVASFYLRFNRIKRIVILGISGFVMSFTNSAVQAVCNKTLSIFGGDLYIGIMTILISVREICQLPAMGFTNGASNVLSYNYGAKAFEKVKKAIVFTTLVSTSVTLIIWILILLFPKVFIIPFIEDRSILDYAVPALHVYFFGFIFMALQLSGQSTFVALGKAKHAVFFSLLRKIIIVVPLTLLLPRITRFGIMGVFLAEPISNAIGGIACYTTMLITVLHEISDKRNGGKE